MMRALRRFGVKRLRRWGLSLTIGAVSLGAGVAAGMDSGWMQGVLVGCAVPAAVAGLAALGERSQTAKAEADRNRPNEDHEL